MTEDGLGDVALPQEGDGLFDAPTDEPAAAAPLALYRRYRPDTFEDVIGQEHVTAPLQRALANNRVNHAYLFSGPRGCGKTTSARILARALNCELGPRAEPCGECRSCRDLARGGPGSIDVIEIDAASHGGVDDARELRERAFFAPVQSHFKVYIIDEAHMVTTQGFNALLKLVEEPPPHVKFVFATTEPDKVIGTIRSRTHHYPFRLVPPRVLSGYLAKLCDAEGITVEPTVLPLVVRAGAGSVRDSLSVLDQLLGGAGSDGVSYAQATALLGYTPDSLLDEFVDAFAAGDAGGVFACVDKVIEVGQDPRRFAEDLLRRLRDLVIVSAVPDAFSSGLVDVAGDQADRLTAQAAVLGPGELTRAAEVIATGLTDMRGTTAPRLHLELMCARALLPGADVDERGVHARLDRLERRLGMHGAGDPAAMEGGAPSSARPSDRDGATGVPARADAASPAAPRPATSPPAGLPASDRPAERPAATDRSPGASPTTPPSSSAPRGGAGAPTRSVEPSAPDESAEADQETTSAGTRGLSVTEIRRLWPQVLEEVKNRRRFTWILLSQNAQVAEVRDGRLLLAMANSGARDSFGKSGNEDILHEALIEALGLDLRIETMVDVAAQPVSAVQGGVPSRPTDPPDPTGPGGEGDDPSRPASSEAASRTQPRVSVPAQPTPVPASSDRSPAQPPGPSAAREQARQSIRSTRTGPPNPAAEDERDAAVTRDDAVIDDGADSEAELLTRHLGAEFIDEEVHGA